MPRPVLPMRRSDSTRGSHRSTISELYEQIGFCDARVQICRQGSAALTDAVNLTKSSTDTKFQQPAPPDASASAMRMLLPVLKSFVHHLFLVQGLTTDDADVAAHALVTADLRGVIRMCELLYEISRLTIAAPSARALSLAKASPRGMYLMPQSGAGISLSASMCASLRGCGLRPPPASRLPAC